MSKVLHEEKPEGKRDEADEDALLEDLLDDISFDDGDAEVEVTPDLAPGTSEPAIAAKPPSAKLVMLRNKIAEPGFRASLGDDLAAGGRGGGGVRPILSLKETVDKHRGASRSRTNISSGVSSARARGRISLSERTSHYAP